MTTTGASNGLVLIRTARGYAATHEQWLVEAFGVTLIGVDVHVRLAVRPRLERAAIAPEQSINLASDADRARALAELKGHGAELPDALLLALTQPCLVLAQEAGAAEHEARQTERAPADGTPRRSAQAILADAVGAATLARKPITPLLEFVRGIFTEGSNLLIGAPKIGKSWLFLGLGLALALGGKAFGRLDVPRARVLYLCLEDGERRTGLRWQQLVHEQPVPADEWFRFLWDCPPLDQGGAEVLDLFLAGNAGRAGEGDPVAVFVDTLSLLRPDESGATRAGQAPYTRDYRFAHQLTDLVRPYAACLVAAHHDRKAAAVSGDFLDMSNSTKGLLAGVDNVVYLSRKAGDQHVTLEVRGRDLEAASLALTWDSRLLNWMLTDVPAAALRQQGGRLTPRIERALRACWELSRRASDHRFTKGALAVALDYQNPISAANVLGDLRELGLVAYDEKARHWALTPKGEEFFITAGEAAGDGGQERKGDKTEEGDEAPE